MQITSLQAVKRGTGGGYTKISWYCKKNHIKYYLRKHMHIYIILCTKEILKINDESPYIIYLYLSL